MNYKVFEIKIDFVLSGQNNEADMVEDLFIP